MINFHESNLESTVQRRTVQARITSLLQHVSLYPPGMFMAEALTAVKDIVKLIEEGRGREQDM